MCRVLGELYKDGRAGNPDNIKQDKVKPPIQLHWHVTDELARIIKEATMFAQKVGSSNWNTCFLVSPAKLKMQYFSVYFYWKECNKLIQEDSFWNRCLKEICQEFSNGKCIDF